MTFNDDPNSKIKGPNNNNKKKKNVVGQQQQVEDPLLGEKVCVSGPKCREISWLFSSCLVRQIVSNQLVYLFSVCSFILYMNQDRVAYYGCINLGYIRLGFGSTPPQHSILRFVRSEKEVVGTSCTRNVYIEVSFVCLFVCLFGKLF